MTKRSLFYRGDMDHEVVTVDNGARVNGGYAEFVSNGPWSDVKTHKVCSRIHTITGYGLPNYTFIEGNTGLILVDTGMNIGSGHELLSMKQAFSDKPVVAIIYSHHHYTGGTQAILEHYSGSVIPIYAHPDVDQNLLSFFSYLAPANLRRGGIQMGAHLPKEGPDAAYAIDEPTFSDLALNAFGHVSVSHPVEDGEEVVIDGLKFVFHYAVADTQDSLIVHVPELDAVVHNTAVMPFMFPMYTLRGDYYRSMPEVLSSIDRLRIIKPNYLIGCHGFPVIGKQLAYEFATAHRDALAFVFQQTVKGINQGKTPSEIAYQLQLPKAIIDRPELFPAYVDLEHMVRGVYRGLIGWWAEDTSELHPPEAGELGKEIIQGFGGVDALLDRAKLVLQEKRYNLAATLMSYVLADQPTHAQAKEIKAAALRKMAQATPTGIQTRHFMLNEALQLEGKIPPKDKQAGTGVSLPVDVIAAMPPTLFLQTLLYTIDTQFAKDLVVAVRLQVTDINKSYLLAIRHGATELTESESTDYDLELKFDRVAWAEVFTGQKNIQSQIESRNVIFNGNDDLKVKFLEAYKEVL